MSTTTPEMTKAEKRLVVESHIAGMVEERYGHRPSEVKVGYDERCSHGGYGFATVVMYWADDPLDAKTVYPFRYCGQCRVAWWRG